MEVSDELNVGKDPSAGPTPIPNEGSLVTKSPRQLTRAHKGGHLTFRLVCDPLPRSRKLRSGADVPIW
jgi:hypothetical protein